MAKTKKQDSALAKATASDLVSVATKSLEQGIGALAHLLSGDEIVPRSLGIVLREARNAEATLKKITETARLLTIMRIKKLGHPVPDTKSLSWTAEDGTKFSMHPTKSGTDPRKLEALLRAKGVKDIGLYMQATVAFAVNEDGTRKALENGTLTVDELKTCDYDESWTVRTPEVK